MARSYGYGDTEAVLGKFLRGRRGHVQIIVGHDQVEVRNEALGARDAQLEVALDDDPTSPMNSLVHAADDTHATSQVVHVAVADELVEKEGVPAPTIVKIDTEGFEEDVLWGMRNTLKNVRGLMIEVHFALLTERGHQRAPDRITSLLTDLGFRLDWVDPSHLQALRSAR